MHATFFGLKHAYINSPDTNRGELRACRLVGYMHMHMHMHMCMCMLCMRVHNEGFTAASSWRGVSLRRTT